MHSTSAGSSSPPLVDPFIRINLNPTYVKSDKTAQSARRGTQVGTMAGRHGMIGRGSALAGCVAGAMAALAVAIAPIASAAPTEQHCLEQHCLAAGTPLISQGTGNVQIVSSPTTLPMVSPHTNNPKWSGLGYNARWPVQGHDPKWQEFGYSPRWNGFQPLRQAA